MIVILLFVLAPVGYYYYTSHSNLGVKGASDSRLGNGLLINVSSKGTWDLYEYLCDSKTNCPNFYGKVSGGQTVDHEVFIEYAEAWKDYEYLKLYVEPGWGSVDSSFGDPVYVPLNSGEASKQIFAGSFSN
jgi:hypothetical protein